MVVYSYYVELTKITVSKLELRRLSVIQKEQDLIEAKESKSRKKRKRKGKSREMHHTAEEESSEYKETGAEATGEDRAETIGEDNDLEESYVDA